jgi:hypothetical protein
MASILLLKQEIYLIELRFNVNSSDHYVELEVSLTFIRNITTVTKY